MQKTFNHIRLFYFVLCVVGAVAGIGCNKEPLYTPPSFKSAAINDFWLEKTNSNPAINRPYQGMIVGDTAIRLMVDYGTDISALEPTIIADADSIFPSGKQNFTNPVHYTVWANGKSASYAVRITVSKIQSPVITALASGYNHVLALRNDGTVWACGDNSSGQLGLGDFSSRNKLTQVPVYDAEKIFTGDAASVIKLKDGAAWGAGNQYGQLGLGHKNPLARLTRVPFLDDATQFAITSNEVIALKADGTLWGAGKNSDKILGVGDADLHATFVKIPVSNVKQLSGNVFNILVQKANGEVWGWGLNHAGQLGLGDKTKRDVPVLLPTPSAGIAKIFAGGGTSFLIDNNGKVWGAGGNGSGQFGLGDFTSRNVFTPLPFFDNKSIDQILPRTGGTAFKESNGNVWGVGDNARGQMGLGSKTQPYTTPIQLPGFTSKLIAGRGETIYALKTDGTLWVWGSNSSGALGIGTVDTEIASPTQIK